MFCLARRMQLSSRLRLDRRDVVINPRLCLRQMLTLKQVIANTLASYKKSQRCSRRIAQ
nr:hypothetical protein [Chlamydomonas moewusii]